MRKKIGELLQSSSFALTVANLGKPAEKQYKADEWSKIAMSLPRLYAVVEAAEISIKAGFVADLEGALLAISRDSDPRISDVANRCARLAWQSQQPLLGEDRLSREIMGCTSASLPEGELQKDTVRVQATAKLLLDYIAQL